MKMGGERRDWSVPVYHFFFRQVLGYMSMKISCPILTEHRLQLLLIINDIFYSYCNCYNS